MAETNVLERAGSLAAEKLKVIQAPAKEKAEMESKAAIEKEEQEKAKDTNKLAVAEAQAKEDERILTVEDKELSEPELKRKAELLETKKKKDESPDEKIKRVKEDSQRRIDEIKSEMLMKENQSSERLKKLEAELAELKRPKVEEDAKAVSKREEAERVAKYVEEDKIKSREDRREMTKEDLEEWYLEDPLAATEWIQERTARRVEERKALEANRTKETSKNLADDFVKKQIESRNKLVAKYPGVLPSKEKLASFAGKTNADINKALCAENEEFRICSEIVAENPEKYLQSENGPELVMAEMDKRLSKNTGNPGKKVVTLTEEELEAKIQAEADRRARLDEGITSTKGKRMEESKGQKSESRQRLEVVAKKAGIPMEALDKTIERRRSIAGASTYEDNN